jgi:hypothetical protein
MPIVGLFCKKFYSFDINLLREVFPTADGPIKETDKYWFYFIFLLYLERILFYEFNIKI